MDLQGSLHIGADVAATAGQLTPGADHGETRVSHGMLQDGVGAEQLVAYLSADAATFGEPDGDNMDVQFLPDGLLLRFAMTLPTIRLAEGTPAGLVDETLRVIQVINAALPRDWQLGFDPEPASASMPGPPDGEILITFADQGDWPSEALAPDGEDIGLAEPRYTITPTGDPEAPFRIEIAAGRVWVDPSQTAGQERLGVIAHEIIHLLGRNHVDRARFPGTLMLPGGSDTLTPHILHPLDREALLAVYGHLQPGIAPAGIAEALGPWSDTSLHVRGALGIPGGEIAFGAALRNDLSQPWAYGPTPRSDLEDNAALSGSALWRGRLLGLTPDSETVGGGAGLTVELATLTGQVDFTDLEHWAANAAPGMMGTGAMWGDGDLRGQPETS